MPLYIEKNMWMKAWANWPIPISIGPSITTSFYKYLIFIRRENEEAYTCHQYWPIFIFG